MTPSSSLLMSEDEVSAVPARGFLPPTPVTSLPLHLEHLNCGHYRTPGGAATLSPGLSLFPALPPNTRSLALSSKVSCRP